MKPIAVITGISGALGQSIAETFSKRGFQIFGIDERVEPTGRYETHLCDLSTFCGNSDEQAAFIHSLRTYATDSPIQVLINNAAFQWVGGMDNLSDEIWMKSFHVNVFSAFSLIKLLAQDLTLSKGSVVNIGSIHARLSKKNFQAYATSKAALSALTRTLALQYGEQFRINCIEPAAIDTPMLQAGFQSHPDRLQELHRFHPQNRIASPKEIAELTYFVSQNVQFLHGSCIDVSGGISCALHDPE